MTRSCQVPPGIDLPAVRRYFADHVPGSTGNPSIELIAGGKSNLTYRVDEGEHQWVLRRPPLGPLTPTAHDMAREFRVVAALRDSAVPVAQAVALCEDTTVLGVPFAVVSYVDGWTLRGAADAAALPAEDARRCAEALADSLAALHAIRPAEVGLDDFGRPDGYLERQVRRWRGQWARVATRQLPQLDALGTRLSEAIPPQSTPGVVHGDYRLDNTILAHDDPGRILAVVDWEMAALGDPLADLGLLLTYWDPVSEPVLGVRHAPSANPGFPDARELAERYAKSSGRDLTELNFYHALGCFKLAVIAEGIHQRYLAGQTVGEGFDTVGAAVPALLDAGLRTLGARS
ncbi:phosphotransferase family protein [Amycolatopsis benzoatilytica]|uniref:phosphotransferase family protein n=1 Tax=Amycolatopsis benzoatilytica TaxID=346045 RepID=UPI0003731472|nr:phosphotransferase family protein [Amycolatopsis benzoatilytica]